MPSKETNQKTIYNNILFIFNIKNRQIYIDKIYQWLLKAGGTKPLGQKEIKGMGSF